MMNYYPNEKEWHCAMMNHKEPVCPECGKGKIVCLNGKIARPHYFECTNQCGFYVNIDYNDCLVE